MNTSRWKLLSSAIATLGLLAALTSFLPWWRITVRSDNPPSISERTINAFHDDSRWGLFVIAYGVVGLLIGLFCLAKRPDDPRNRPALWVLIVCPILALAMIPLDYVAVRGTTSRDVAIGIGAIVTWLLMLGWLGCAIALRSIAARAPHT